MPRILISFCLILFFASLNTSDCSAQFDMDGNRWSAGSPSSTAFGQAQGYDQGDPLKLTWGFAQEGINIDGFVGEPASNNNIRAFLNGIYSGGEAEWLPLFQQVFDRWDSISGLEYQYESNDDGAVFAGFASRGVLGTRADVRIGGHRIDGNSGTLAYNFFPAGNAGWSGDMVIDTDDDFFDNTTFNDSRPLRNVVSHEHGHGVGMEHLTSTDTQQLMEPSTTSTPDYDGPQYFDILAAQRGYGDFNEKSNDQLGNDTFDLATDLGSIADGAMFEIGMDAANDPTSNFVGQFDTDFFSIDDTSDTDFYSVTFGSDGVVDILLEALGFEFNVSGTTFDSKERSDLGLELFDTDGTTSLGSSNLTGLGGMESLSGIAVSAGTYFISVTGTNNVDGNLLDTQFYGLSGSFTATGVPEPGTLAIFAFGAIGLLVRRRK